MDPPVTGSSEATNDVELDDLPPRSARTIPGVVLTVLGLLVVLLSELQSHHESHSYTDGAAPATYVRVTAGHTYSLSITGGLGAARKLTNAASLACSITTRGSGTSRLSVLTETSDKAVDQIASFIAPVSGDVHVACSGLSAVYVDDADGQFDLAGLLVLLATILLAIGVPLTLSGLAIAQRHNSGLLRRGPPFTG